MKISKVVHKLRQRVLAGNEWLKSHKKTAKTKRYKKNLSKYIYIKEELKKLIWEYLFLHPEVLKKLLIHEEGESGLVYWAREQWFYKDKLVKKAKDQTEDNLLIFYKDIL